jgi:ribosomal protein S18 acetylase RimI-like enzyme
MQFEHAQTDYQSYNIPMPLCYRRNAVEGNRQLETKLFYNENMCGVFFSYIYNGMLRVYITLDNDTDVYNAEIAFLLQVTIAQSNCESGLLWVRKKTKKIITFLESEFHITISDELFFYESKKFAMHREQFNKEYDNNILNIKSFDDSYLDACLRLWEESMIFAMPPKFHLRNRSHHLEQFRFYRDYLMFETFWKNDELIGFYWLNNDEVDLIAVSPKHQRVGYGSLILTRAIEMIFQTTDSDIAWLIVSSFNEKACSFYKKNGMVVHGEYRISRIDDPIESDLQMRVEHINI